MPIHAPLTFDIIDRWKQRSVGRCVYYVAPPDGRIYTARPANSAEAEARRTERFQIVDAPGAAMPAPEQETNPIFPMTLDLRLPAPAQKIAAQGQAQ